ncbi:related to A-factor-processing enzyme [Saccharomycodes ludwigii]|uniref:Related to A-factor-processing enzyme n=1 Tax=Saccharomycodes ludwigii TaxID=36035 RepID=A0A376B182_9ASCO|nr:related to A-factor-processing enzyme [Saccharomycodes ludwigii]
MLIKKISTAIPKQMPYKILESNFLKSDIDDRSYRYIQLPNKLRCLVIQDTTTDKSAASMDVHIGSFQDPDELPGLAHFCEHLLFMGSEKFPDENEYSKFLNKHGGDSNAYTSSMNTNYYFQVNHDHLKGALDRFSGFFSCPLFNNDSTAKEINAVDSENKKNLQNDTWRLFQLEKTLTNPKHPYHKFSTGNLQTLDKIPVQNGIDVRQELLKFHNKYYSANLMKLCVLGREDLDTLSDWCYELFQNISNKDLEVPHDNYDFDLFIPEFLQKIIYVKPVKDLKKLEIMFKAPDVDQLWELKPQHYFSHLIGHEGEGSLLSYLKEKAWAHNLSCGGHTISPDNGSLSIHIDLTPKGIENYEKVVEACFQYIEMMKHSGIPKKWIFEELQDIEYASFKFKQKTRPSSTVSHLSKSLEKDSYIPPNKILATNLLDKYDADEIENYLSYLTVENSRIVLISRHVKTNLVEKWYGTQYAVVPYSDDFIDTLENLPENHSLHLPRKNPYITTNFHVDPIPEGIEPLKAPYLLQSNAATKLWFKKDDRFGVPRGYVIHMLTLPFTYCTLKNNVLTSLFCNLVNDHLNSTIIYDASIADLTINLSKTNSGLTITFYGYNEKAQKLILQFLLGVKNFESTFDRFKVFKQKLIQNFENSLYNVPYQQISSIWSNLIHERSYLINDKLKALAEIEFEDLKLFEKLIFKEIFVETIVHGNFNASESIEINSQILEVLDGSSLQKLEEGLQRSIVINDKYRFIKGLADKENINSCIQYTVQISENVGDGILNDLDFTAQEETGALMELFTQIIHEPCFNQLRTIEQLGYVVFSGTLSPTSPYYFLRILVQSEYTSNYVESRIYHFIKHTIHEVLNKMTVEDFEAIKRGVIGTLSQKFKNLGEETSRFNNAISSGDLNFEKNERRARIVATITLENIKTFYNNCILKNDEKLIIHLKSKKNGKSGEHSIILEDCVKIQDVQEFKLNMPLGSLPKPIKKIKVVEPKL